MTAFNPILAAQAAVLPTATATATKVPATLWLNIGVTVTNSKGESEFIALPVGIPLDNNKDLPNTAFNATKLALLKSFLALAADIPAGETKDVPLQHLTMQIRRVSTEEAKPTHDFANIFG